MILQAATKNFQTHRLSPVGFSLGYDTENNEDYFYTCNWTKKNSVDQREHYSTLKPHFHENQITPRSSVTACVHP